MKYLFITLLFILCACGSDKKEPQQLLEEGEQLEQIEPILEPIELVTPKAEFNLIDEALEQLGLNKDQYKTELVASKPFPNRPEETIIVIPEIADTDDNDDTFFTYHSHILIVDSSTGKIKYRFYESDQTNQWLSDALKFASIKIDTAPYKLSENKRAFGVRINFYNSSQPNPYNKETISLFVKDGKTLKKVLNHFTIQLFNGETDTTCYAEFTKQEKVLIIKEEKSNNYFNILVKNKISAIFRDEDTNGECQENINITTETKTLKFNGQHYE
jgi:hypothetical protein